MPDRLPPNVLFILTDQQRADALGAMSPWMHTPALDRLADESVMFTRCITQSPGCIPARVSLMTGLYPHNHGVWGNRGFNLPAKARNWVRGIQAAGYRTSVVGKTHLHDHHDLDEARPLVQSWGYGDVLEISGPHGSANRRSAMTDEWERAGLLDAYREDLAARARDAHFTVRPSPLGREHHYDSFVGVRAVEQVRAYEGDRPWFCCVAFAGPHEPWDAPEPFASLHDSAAVPPPLLRITSRAPGRPTGRLLDDRFAGDDQRMAGLSAGDLARLRANYAGKVSLIDHYVGALFEVLKQRGELERTIVVFASDHGEMNGDHGLIHKSCFLRGAVTVPLLIRLPAGARGGRRVSAPVELNDVGPTIAEAVGAPVGHPQWGRSLWPLLRDEAATVREVAISEQRGEVMLVDERWKVAFNADGEAYLCVDLEQDPDEQSNLAGTETARPVEARFRERLLHFILGTQLMDDWHGGWPSLPAGGSPA